MTPSLFVLFVSGWGSEADKDDNLFLGAKPFLDQVLLSYPTIMLASEPKEASFDSIYKKLGAVSNDQSLSRYLSESGIRQRKIAGPDRYGHLTESFGGSDISYEKEEWVYLSYPHGETLKNNPSLEVPKLMKELDASLKYKRETVTFGAVSQLWALGLYRDPYLLNAAVHSLSKDLMLFIDKAVQEGVRILLVSDSSLAESFSQVFQASEPITKTASSLPCVLIHPSVDGLRATSQDYASDRATQLAVSGGLEDIAPTIVSLMGKEIPSWMQGKPLFEDLLQRTI